MSILMFNRWAVDDIKVSDIGLKKYINLEPRIVPRTGGRNTKVQFHKSRTAIVERLINRIMVPGHKAKKHFITSGRNTGKAVQAYKMVEDVFKVLEQKTKKNPIEVFVKAVENAAPREEIITIEYGGARYPKAVECSPQRRIDQAIKNMIQGAYQRSFAKKLNSKDALAEEIMAAYQLSNKSNAISKKLELERQADSSR